MLPVGTFVVLVRVAVIVVMPPMVVIMMPVIMIVMLVLPPGEVDVRARMINRMSRSVGGVCMRHPRQLAGEIRHDQHGRKAAASHANS